MLIGRLSDNLPHRAAACVENIIKLLLQKQGTLRNPSTDHWEAAAVHVFGQGVGDEGGRGRGEVGGLDDHAVAGGDGTTDGHQTQLKGVVPGAHHQHHTVRLRQHVRPVQHGGQALLDLRVVVRAG